MLFFEFIFTLAILLVFVVPIVFIGVAVWAAEGWLMLLLYNRCDLVRLQTHVGRLPLHHSG